MIIVIITIIIIIIMILLVQTRPGSILPRRGLQSLWVSVRLELLCPKPLVSRVPLRVPLRDL